MKSVLRKIIAVVLLVAMLFLVNSVPVKAEDNDDKLDLYAQSAVLMDAVSGRILYAKNADEKRPMASTTKIMTCILALEYGNLEDYVEVSSYAAKMPKVKLGMQSGEYYKLEDLLYSLMLESHNDSAVAIAEHIGGSVEGFAGMMNQKARDIGCHDTFFITPNGLDATATLKNGEIVAHSTTAADLAKMMSYCILNSPEKDRFLHITQKASYQLTSYKRTGDGFVSGGRSFSCNNHNAFLNMMEGALSGKTGFTGNAGYCYVGDLREGERYYVVALLACGWPNNKNYKWSDTQKLMKYGLSEYTLHTFSEDLISEEKLPSVRVVNGKTDRIGETAKVRVRVSERKTAEEVQKVLMKEAEKVEVVHKQEEVLVAPVKAGTKVGSIQYKIEGVTYLTEEIVLQEEIEEIDFFWCLMQILKKYAVGI